MGGSFFKIGMRFKLRGKEYTVIDINPSIISCQRIPDLQLIDFLPSLLVTEAELLDRPVNDISKEKEVNIDLDLIPEHQRDLVSKRLALIKPLILLYQWKQGNQKAGVLLKTTYVYLLSNKDDYMPSYGDLIKSQAKQSGLTERTLWRYWSSWKRIEIVETLISKQGTGIMKRTDGRELRILDPRTGEVLQSINVRLKEEQISIIEDVLQKKFLSLHKVKCCAIYNEIEVSCKTSSSKVPIPCESTIRKILKRIQPAVLTYYREGKKAFEEKFSLVERGFSNEEAFFSLHIVQMDFVLLDVDVVDDIYGVATGRPWLLLGADTFSRIPWTFYLGWGEPSINMIRSALEFGVFPKNTKEKWETINEWDVWGIPKIIYVDNGFDSKELRRIVEDVLGGELRFRPPGTPRYGAVIERLFGTINTKLIHNLPGTRKSSVKELGEYDAEGKACIRLSTLKSIIVDYLTDIYPYEIHRGLPPDTPNPYLRYLKGLEMGLPDFIPMQEYERFKIDLLEEKSKPVTVNGIRNDNIFYASKEIRHLVKGKNINYKIKFDSDDVSYCLVLDAKQGKWIRVEADRPQLALLNRMDRFTWKAVYKKIVDMGLEKAGNVPATESVHLAYKNIDEKIKKDYGRSRKARKMAAQMQILPTTSTADLRPQKKVLEELLTIAREAEKTNLSENADGGDTAWT